DDQGNTNAMRPTLLSQPYSPALLSVLALVCAGCPVRAQSFEWQTATPKSQGVSERKLDALQAELAKRKTSAFLVIRNDRIVREWYAPRHGPKKKHGAASLSKTTVAGLALGLLVSDRKLELDTPVARLVAAWKNDP